jgi:hypothetical protein
LFESVYLDYTGDPPAASEYTRLLSRLREAELAEQTHKEMNERMLARHAARVKEARARLEAELDRLRREAIRLGIKP